MLCSAPRLLPLFLPITSGWTNPYWTQARAPSLTCAPYLPPSLSLSHSQSPSRPRRKPHAATYIVQRYVSNPLLLDSRKFTLRAFVLLARSEPMLAFLHDGYARLALEEYQAQDIDNRFANFSNARVQRQHADYARKGRDSLMSFEQVG